VETELWGDNFVYVCRGAKDDAKNGIYWNGQFVTKGWFLGMHKNLMLVENRDVPNENDLPCYSLYKNGKAVLNSEKTRTTYCNTNNSFGAFGDNWTYVTQDSSNKGDIYYNGKKIYSGDNLQVVIFGNDILYGSFDELFFNGELVGSKEDITSGWNSLLTNITLVDGNYAFFSGNEVNYNGKYYKVTDLHEGEVKLFGNNWLITEVSDSFGGDLFFNGKKIVKYIFSTVALFGNNLAYVEEGGNDENYGKLIFRGELFDDNFYYIGGYALFGDHIAYNKYSKNVYFIDGTNIGEAGQYTSKEKKELISSINVWPKITSDTELGTQNSNNANINDTYSGDRDSGYLDVSGLHKEYTFDEMYLYCTNQWK
jgi:hypothetical protein